MGYGAFPEGGFEDFDRFEQQFLRLDRSLKVGQVSTLGGNYSHDSSPTECEIAEVIEGGKISFNLGESHRNFGVGCCAKVEYLDNSGEVAKAELLHGANYKPFPEDTLPNVHAEYLPRKKADAHAGNELDPVFALMAVVAKAQPDKQSGRISPTLHICGLCRDAFCGPNSTVTSSSLILTANRGLTTVQFGIFNDFLDFHGNKPELKINTVRIKNGSYPEKVGRLLRNPIQEYLHGLGLIHSSDRRYAA